MNGFLTITRLTLREAARRRVLLAGLIGACAFLLLYATGFHFVGREAAREGLQNELQRRLVLNLYTMVGLYAANFLSVLSAVLLPIDTLSGEIASGVLQTIAAKPVRRSGIVLGKWFGYWLVCAGYLLLTAGGVLAIARFLHGFAPPGVPAGLSLMLLEVTCLVSLSIAGGTRLSTVTNGVVAFGLYGLAFLGGWIEQVASMTGNVAARNIGTVTSLVIPTESLWQLAAHLMQPRIIAELHVTPFSMGAVPSPAMVVWAAAWAAALLLLAVRGFARRPL
ncbi:MAG: ABC transporter permease [Candidatus Eisenbacteria bacterium]|nr:ABC transporter permease [Candidatus Eisenbacteria bacterium]